MKTRILGIGLFLLLLFSFACDRDKICLEDQFCPTSNYIPLEIGNYWVYETTSYNFSNYSITFLGDTDTVKVIGDTIIGNNKYFTIKGDHWMPPFIDSDTTYWRDSSGYLINLQGHVLFSAFDHDRILNKYDFQGERFIDYSILDSTVVAITPIGLFNCLDYSGCFFNGLVFSEYKYHNYFAEDVGIVYQTQFVPLTQIFREKRRSLKAYHLE